MELPYGLTKKQAATAAFVATFVTVIGGFLLVLWFRRQNKKGNINA